MAVNVPLVTISDLTEQSTAADSDCMVIGGTDAKKITWANIAKLILAKITGGASTILTSNLATNRALVSNSSGKVAVSDITSTELGYLDNAKGNLQNQIDELNTNLGVTHTIHNQTDNLYVESYKYGDGRLVINMRIYRTGVAITSTSGSIYYAQITDLPNFPVTFSAKPTVLHSTENGGTSIFIFGGTPATTTSPGGVFLARGASATGNVRFNIHAEGRWK